MNLENTLWEITENNAVFQPINKINSYQTGAFMRFETFSDDEDGTFPRVSDYVRLANRIDKNGASAFLTWVGKSKIKFDNGYVVVQRESKWSNEATLLFKEPIQVVIGYLNNEPQTITVNKIVGEFDYEWSWLRNGRQDKIANMCDIYFNCKEYHSI